MKKLAICCLALAVCAVFVPTSHAASKCIALSDFCDRVSVNITNVGGQQGTELVGLWDWTCDGVTLAPMAGGAGTKLKFAGFLAGIGLTENWTANKGNHITDIYLTADGVNESPLVTGEGFSLTNGSCGFATPNNGKPSLHSLIK